mgnify:CR=1 FL=1
MEIKVVKRDTEIISMLEIIRNMDNYKENSQNGLVILLNGAWGTGKTTYLNDLKEAIKKADDIELFNCYNAYEYDCYDNAYIPFFSSIAESIKLDNENLSSIVKSSFIGMACVLKSIGKTVVKQTAGVDFQELTDDLKDTIEGLDTDYLKEFNEFKENKSIINEKLCNACENGKHVFIVDELDRCKPNFAMDTLEIIKHFFDIPNCIFIISVDKLQLEQSARAIYGAIDCEKYFSKLFDYQFNLLPISVKDSVSIKGFPEYSEFMSYAGKVFDILKISVRDGKKILNEFFSKCENWTIRQNLFMLFFFILKYTDLSFFNAIFNGEFKKYSKLIRSEYDSNLEKYAQILDHNMGSGYKYGALLEFFTLKMDLKYYDLNNTNSNNSSFLDYGTYNTNKLIEALKEHVPNVDYTVSMKENIRKIVG